MEVGTPNIFSLQLNTDIFSTSALICAPNPSCQGWQQFAYSNTDGSLFIEYWLMNYGTCPGGWESDGHGNCWSDSYATQVPAQKIANLVGLSLTAKAAAGMDTAIISITSSRDFPYVVDQLKAIGTDSVLNLAGRWHEAEFNILGDGNNAMAQFNDGATIAVRVSVDDGTTNAPACATVYNTAESNDLNIFGNSCSRIGGAAPAIVFMESKTSSSSGADLAAWDWTCHVDESLGAITFKAVIKNVGTGVWKPSRTGYYIMDEAFGTYAQQVAVGSSDPIIGIYVDKKFTLDAYPNFPALDAGNTHELPDGLIVDFDRKNGYRAPIFELHHPDDVNSTNDSLVTPADIFEGKEFLPNGKLYNHCR